MSEAIASKAERLAAYNANIAAAEKDPSLSPETGKPLSKMNAARFGAGFLVFGVLWMSGLGIVSAVLLPMHYKTIPGVNADALVGIVNAFTAVASLVANLMFGNFSDRSRSRFGRRTPWFRESPSCDPRRSFAFWVCFRCGDAYALLHLVLTKVQEGGEEDDGNPWNTPDYRRQTICNMI